MTPFANRLEYLGNENAFKIGADIRRVEAAGRDVIKLNLGEPDYDSAENINCVAIDQIKAGNSHYSDPKGLPGLRQSIARTLTETRGVKFSPEQIVITSGGKPPIAYTLLSYVDPGDEVVYPNPGFPIYESWIRFVRAVPRPVNLAEEMDFRFRAADLEPLISPKTKLLIINSPSNPTGGVLSRSDLADIAGLVRDKAHPHCRILSDEVYEEILFDGLTHQSIVSEPGMAERTIIMNSHSKTYAMTGWRVGYAALPTTKEAEVFTRWNVNIYSCTPPFIQMAALEAMENPVNRQIVDSMRIKFEKRRDRVIGLLNKIEGFTCAKPRGAFYAFPNIEGACRKLGVLEYYDQMVSRGEKVQQPSTLFQMFALYGHGVAVLDRGAFGTLESEGRHFIRISLASSLKTLEEGVKRLKAAASDTKGFQKFIAERD